MDDYGKLYVGSYEKMRRRLKERTINFVFVIILEFRSAVLAKAILNRDTTNI